MHLCRIPGARGFLAVFNLCIHFFLEAIWGKTNKRKLLGSINVKKWAWGVESPHLLNIQLLRLRHK